MTPRLGFDDNLGLSSQFSQQIACETVPFHDVALLIEAFEHKALDAIFIPVGTLPYITVPYNIIAQATLSPTRQHLLHTQWMSLHHTTLMDITDAVIGRVNPYCTTSYWGPMISLMQKLPKGTSLTFKDTGSFEALLQHMLNGEVGYAMLWDEVLKKYPHSSKAHALSACHAWPTPIIISQTTASPLLQERIPHFYAPEPGLFFNGFAPPDSIAIENFIKDMFAAKSFFKQ